MILLEQGDEIEIMGLRDGLSKGHSIPAKNKTKNLVYAMTYTLSPRQVEIMLHGGLINRFKRK